MSRKRLFFDIEVTPNGGDFWRSGYKLNIGSHSIKRERVIICIGYKWEGDKEVHCIKFSDTQCDKQLIKDFNKVLLDAEEIVGHNINRFDLPWIRTRALYHNIQMVPMFNKVDTLTLARRHFYFNDNRLEYLAKFLKVSHKLNIPYSAWDKIVHHNCQKSLERMMKYCKRDVVTLEKVYEKLATHIDATTHFGVVHLEDKSSCKSCGSDVLHRQYTRTLASGAKKVTFRCRTCGKYSTFSEKTAEKVEATRIMAKDKIKNHESV